MKKLEAKIKQKKLHLETAAWMNKHPYPLPLFSKGQEVEVYRGAVWNLGTVIESTSRGCIVKMEEPLGDIRVYDARCIRPTAKL